MASERPFVLSIAGHDPSAGAGLTADLKTFEQHQVYGLSVCTALTVQHDTAFASVNWVSEQLILQQLTILTQRFEIVALKIGLLPNWNLLQSIFIQLPNCPIVFDPILKASAGFVFHTDTNLQALLRNITLLTPNREEIQQLLPNKTPEQAAQQLSQYCAILLKGGHDDNRLGYDQLWENGELTHTFPPTIIATSGKHGSGCILSAAITVQIAKGKSLAVACELGKRYLEQRLNSNDTLLAYHMLDASDKALLHSNNQLHQGLYNNISKHITLTEQETKLIASVFMKRTIKSKEVLLFEGAACRKLYFVASGLLRAYKYNEDGKEITVMFAKKDWWITDMHSFVAQSAATVSIEALKDSVVFSINYTDWNDLYDKVAGFNKLWRVLMQNAYCRAQQRVVQNLTLSASKRYQLFLQKYPEVAALVTQRQIASYLGITPEFLSSIKRSLKLP